MKITALEESTDFTTLDTEKLFSKLKSHVLSYKGRPNYDASLTNKALITSARVGGHDANPTNTISSSLEFALSPLAVASGEQYESISDDKIALLVRKFCALHKFHKERRRSPRGCFECGDITHFILDCPKRKNLDSSISTTTPTRTTPATRAITRSTASETKRRRRSSKRSYPKCVLS
jgi:hypothetical protein